MLSTNAKGPRVIKNENIREMQSMMADTAKKYVEFLIVALQLHSENTEFVSAAAPYPFKYYQSPTRKTDAITVKNYADYVAMVRAIKGSKSKAKIVILIHMSAIKRTQIVSFFFVIA